MQRTIVLALACIMALAGVTMAAELPVVLVDNFSQGVIGEVPAGWEKALRGDSPDTPHITDAMARSGDRSLRLQRGQGNTHITNGVVRFFTPLRERAIVSFWFNATDLERNLVFSLAGEEQGTNVFGTSTGPFLVLRNAAVQAYSDGQFQDVGLYEAGRWHKVTIDIDVQNGTYDVFLDDATEPGNLVPFKFRNPGIHNMASIGLGFQAATASRGFLPVYIDDIEVRGR